LIASFHFIGPNLQVEGLLLIGSSGSISCYINSSD